MWKFKKKWQKFGEKKYTKTFTADSKKKIEIIVIKTEDEQLFLMVGNERINISDFKSRSSAHGDTELLITIKGGTVSTELSANAI